MIRATDIVSTWFAPLIAALNGRTMAFDWMVRHRIGSEPILQADEIARHDSVEAALRAMPAHEFVETSGEASTWDCMVKAKEAGPLYPNIDDHNNNPAAYHHPGIWQGRLYDERGRNQQSIATSRSIINEVDVLFEPDGIQWLNEPEVDEDYHAEVAAIAPIIRARGMLAIASAPGPYSKATLKGVHLAILKRWSLDQTEAVIAEFLDFDRVFDELWIPPNGSVFREHEAQQIFRAVRASIELGRPLCAIFVGEEGYSRLGPLWLGRHLQTFIFSAGRLTPFGVLLDRYLLEIEDSDPGTVIDFNQRAALAVGRILRRRDQVFEDRPRSPAWLSRDEEFKRRTRELIDAIEGRLTT